MAKKIEPIIDDYAWNFNGMIPENRAAAKKEKAERIYEAARANRKAKAKEKAKAPK